MRNLIRSFPQTLALAGLLLVPITGCGGPAYDALYNKQLDRLRASAPFRTLFAPTAIPDSNAKIRIPMIFGKSYTADSAHPDDGGQIKPERLQPPFMQLPGLKLCYEGQTGTGDGMVPFYCYLASVEGGDAAKLADELQAKLKETFKDTPATWESVHARTPQDKAITWRKLRVTGEQPFFVTQSSGPVAFKKDGIFELWLYEGEGQVILIGWRTPKEIEGPAPAGAPAAQPTLTLTQPVVEGKPDLSSMPALTAGTLTFDAPAAEPEG